MQACPVCAARSNSPSLLSLGAAPVFCNVQWQTREEAVSAAKGPIELAGCDSCGHVFNAAFDPNLVAYAPGYENSQHASTVFAGYAEQLVERLVSTHGLAGRPIVDIGCGRGDLLRMLARRAGGQGFGFDPSFKDAGTVVEESAVLIVNEYFDVARAKDIRPALVCCRHVLEHVPDPVSFLRSMRDALVAAGDAVLYLEVPNGNHLFRTGGVWDVLYEHYSYFTPYSLELAMRNAGLEVLDIYEDFGAQFLCVDARPAHNPSRKWAPEPPPTALLVEGARRMMERVALWRTWAAEPRSRSECATIWGAGSKGVMFLNIVDVDFRVIPIVIDQNPAKQDKFISGTGQQIVLPSAVALRGVTDILLMNSIYATEVRSRLRVLEIDAQLLFADT